MNRSTQLVVGLIVVMMLLFAFLAQVGTDWWMSELDETAQRAANGEIDIEEWRKSMAEDLARMEEEQKARQAAAEEAQARRAEGVNWLSVALALGAGGVLVFGGIGALIFLKEEEEELPPLPPMPPGGVKSADPGAPAEQPPPGPPAGG